VTPQFEASLTDDSRVIIYDRNLFIIEATVALAEVELNMTRPVIFRAGRVSASTPKTRFETTGLATSSSPYLWRLSYFQRSGLNFIRLLTAVIYECL
jgi:hypothetical protein